MKFQVTFKTPDAVSEALSDLDDQTIIDRLEDFASQWVKYGEYVTLEFDSVKGTCRVLEI